jgi:hypothetical protein
MHRIAGITLKQNGELRAADPADIYRMGTVARQSVRHRTNCLITNKMPKLIIDTFEIVQITKQN